MKASKKTELYIIITAQFSFMSRKLSPYFLYVNTF